VLDAVLVAVAEALELALGEELVDAVTLEVPVDSDDWVEMWVGAEVTDAEKLELAELVQVDDSVDADVSLDVAVEVAELMEL
jgi:hypothetical protein